MVDPVSCASVMFFTYGSPMNLGVCVFLRTLTTTRADGPTLDVGIPRSRANTVI